MASPCLNICLTVCDNTIKINKLNLFCDNTEWYLGRYVYIFSPAQHPTPPPKKKIIYLSQMFYEAILFNIKTVFKCVMNNYYCSDEESKTHLPEIDVSRIQLLKYKTKSFLTLILIRYCLLYWFNLSTKTHIIICYF